MTQRQILSTPLSFRREILSPDAKENLPQVGFSVTSTAVQVLKQLQKTIPLPACEGEAKLLQGIKFGDSHVLGLRSYSVKKFLPFMGYKLITAVFTVNMDTNSVHEEPMSNVRSVMPLPSTDASKRFAVLTYRTIQVYQLEREKFKLQKTFACEQFGELFPSLDGRYWMTKAVLNIGLLSYQVPSKLLKLEADYKVSHVVNIRSFKPIGWFSGHFLYPSWYVLDTVLAVHPETFATYELPQYFHRDQLFEDKILVQAELWSEDIEDEKLPETVSAITQAPLAVSRIVCHYLTHNTQRFFPNKIFEPYIPDCLPVNMHAEARKLQWEFWAKNDEGEAESCVLLEVLTKMSKLNFNRMESYKIWIKQFKLSDYDTRIKTFFEKVAQEMEIMRRLIK